MRSVFKSLGFDGIDQYFSLFSHGRIVGERVTNYAFSKEKTYQCGWRLKKEASRKKSREHRAGHLTRESTFVLW